MNGKLKMTIARATMICLIMMLASRASAQECGEYVVTVIAGPQCGADDLVSIIPQGISETGDVVGHGICPIGVSSAFYWTPKEGLQFIPMPNGTSESKALAISGSKIVGFHRIIDDEFGQIAFLYDYAIDEFTSLGVPPGAARSEAHAINSNGEIVGWFGGGEFATQQAFIWRDGEMIDLNPDLGTLKSQAKGINANSAVTGWMGISKLTDSRAYIWEKGKVTELPPLPGGFANIGEAIDCAKRVAGWGIRQEGNPPQNVTRAFLWQDGETIDLGTLPGFLRSGALGIRSSPLQIVGQVWSGSQGNTDGGFLWQNGVMSDVQDLLPGNSGLDLSDAVSINQKGQILSRAHSDPLDATVGVIISPVVGASGDLNNNCHITTVDLLMLLENWGTCNCCPADLDGNGSVGTSDLLILLSNWG